MNEPQFTGAPIDQMLEKAAAFVQKALDAFWEEHPNARRLGQRKVDMGELIDELGVDSLEPEFIQALRHRFSERWHVHHIPYLDHHPRGLLTLSSRDRTGR